MIQKNVSPWFSFNGVRNDTMKCKLTSMPTISVPAVNGVKLTAARRDGFLWQDDHSISSGTIKITFLTDGDADIHAIDKWLTGAGDFIYSVEPNRAYKARRIREISKTFKRPRFNGREMTVTFDIQPYAYLTPAAANITLSASGTTVTNPGTAESRPLIRINSTGSFTLTINGELIEGDSVTSGAIMDCEKQDCFDVNMTSFLNQKFTMDNYPTLAPGANIITWTGDITSLVITPRWRYL